MKKMILGFLVILIGMALVNQALAQERCLPKKQAVQMPPHRTSLLAPPALPCPAPLPALPASDLVVKPALGPWQDAQPSLANPVSEPAVPAAPGLPHASPLTVAAAEPQPAVSPVEPVPSVVPPAPRLFHTLSQPLAAAALQSAVPPARNTDAADPRPSWQAAAAVPLRKEVIKVNYIDAREAMAILNSYKSPRGRIQEQRNRNTLIIEDTPEFVDKLLSILKELDVRPLDLLFTVDVIMGSMQEELGAPLSESDSLVKELKNLLKYQHFARLDSTMIKIQDNSRSAQRMGGQGIGLHLELYPRHIKDGKNDAFQVELILLQTTKRIPFKQLSGGEEKILRYDAVDLEKSLTLLQTSLSLKDGEHSVVGVSKLNGGDTALILVIEGKVIK